MEVVGVVAIIGDDFDCHLNCHEVAILSLGARQSYIFVICSVISLW